ncbi:hypothetical protein D9M70_399340 [compost metagenome]
MLRHQRQQVGHRRFVADRAISFAADECQIGDVVGLARGVAAAQQCLGENVMKLQAVLTARVVQGNGQVAAPILGTCRTKRQEQGLEQRAALVAPLQLFRRDLKAAELETQPVDQFIDAAAIADDRQILIQNGLTGTPRETAFGIGGQGPVAQLVRLVVAQRIVAAVSEIRQHHQQEGRRQQRRAINAKVAAGEVERKLHSIAGFLPCLLQLLDVQVANDLEPRLTGGKRHQVLQVQAEIKIKSRAGTGLLKILECLQRVPPLGSDLRQRQVGTAQLGAQ